MKDISWLVVCWGKLVTTSLRVGRHLDHLWQVDRHLDSFWQVDRHLDPFWQLGRHLNPFCQLDRHRDPFWLVLELHPFHGNICVKFVIKVILIPSDIQVIIEFLAFLPLILL